MTKTLSGAVAVIKDFSDEAALEKVREEFAAVAAHELRNPLAVISASVQLLQTLPPAEFSERARGFVDMVSRSVKRLSNLTDGLLDVARLEAELLTFSADVVDMRELAREVVKQQRQEFENKGLTLALLDSAAGEVLVFGIRDRLAQVLNNLLSNAAKYTDTGGAVLRLSCDHQKVCIEVSDTGIGMLKADVERAFDRFYRSSSHQVSERPGSGLGLHITRSIVEKHGGAITASSTLDEGSSFTIELPKRGAADHSSPTL